MSNTTLFDASSMRDSIRRYALQADNTDHNLGMRWYADTAVFTLDLAEHYDIPVANVAAALAHLSPRVTWDRNKQMLRELLATGHTNGLHAAVMRAGAALRSNDPIGTLHGCKTSAFARNILGDYTPVTVDVWALRAAIPGFPRKVTPTRKQYAMVAAAYTAVAVELEVSPAQLQAIVWVAIRGKAE